MAKVKERVKWFGHKVEHAGIVAGKFAVSELEKEILKRKIKKAREREAIAQMNISDMERKLREKYGQ